MRESSLIHASSYDGAAEELTSVDSLVDKLRHPNPFSIAQGNILGSTSRPFNISTTLWYVANGALLLIISHLLGVVGKKQADLFFLYYQPFAPVLAMLWFWGLNVRYFERNHVRYDACFSPEDQKYLIPSTAIFHIANFLSALVLTSGALFLFYCSGGQFEMASYQPPGIYVVMLVMLVFPGKLLFQDTRRFFANTLWRVATPIRSVTWADFLLADILTSLAKAVSDFERSVCHLATGDVMAPEGELCSDGSWIIPLGLALPYAWRLVQCIRIYLDTGAKPQLYNAIKYSTAFPLIALSAVKYHVTIAAWESTYKPMWLIAAFVNSAYSYYWDIERDWEISFFSQFGHQSRPVPAPVLPPNSYYRKGFYLYLMVSNFILRLSWTYKLSPHLRRNHVAVFCIVLLEAFRRFQWIFVRIEVELRKLQNQAPELGPLLGPHAGTVAYASVPGGAAIPAAASLHHRHPLDRPGSLSKLDHKSPNSSP